MRIANFIFIGSLAFAPTPGYPAEPLQKQIQQGNVPADVLNHVERVTTRLNFEFSITEDSKLLVSAQLQDEEKFIFAGVFRVDRTQPSEVYLGRFRPVELLTVGETLYVVASREGDTSGNRVLMDMVPFIIRPRFFENLILFANPSVALLEAIAFVVPPSGGITHLLSCAANAFCSIHFHRELVPRYRAHVQYPKIVSDSSGRPLIVRTIERDVSGEVLDIELISETGQEHRLSEISALQRAPLNCESRLLGD